MTLFEEGITLLRSLVFEEGNTFLGFLTAAGFLIVWGVLVSFLFFLFAKKRIPVISAAPSVKQLPGTFKKLPPKALEYGLIWGILLFLPFAGMMTQAPRWNLSSFNYTRIALVLWALLRLAATLAVAFWFVLVQKKLQAEETPAGTWKGLALQYAGALAPLAFFLLTLLFGLLFW